MERMHAVMAENEQAINAARSANQRIATAIVNAVQAHQSESAGYSAKGRSGKDSTRPPVSVQIDQHLSGAAPSTNAEPNPCRPASHSYMPPAARRYTKQTGRTTWRERVGKSG